jgi:hypothetical protein
MKPYLFLVFILLSLNGFSQQKEDSLTDATSLRVKFGRFVDQMLRQNPGPKAKPTTLQQRLTGAAKRFNSSPSPFYDSVACQYSGSNSSKFDFNDLDYHFIYPNPGFFAIINCNFSNTEVQADTLRFYSNNSSSQGGIRAATYSPTGNLTYLEYGSPTPNWKIYNQFDANDRITEYLSISTFFSPTVLDSTEKVIFYYDLQGRRIVDSVYHWEPVEVYGSTRRLMNIIMA